jgi:hypothetical protein
MPATVRPRGGAKLVGNLLLKTVLALDMVLEARQMSVRVGGLHGEDSRDDIPLADFADASMAPAYLSILLRGQFRPSPQDQDPSEWSCGVGRSASGWRSSYSCHLARYPAAAPSQEPGVAAPPSEHWTSSW